MDVSIKTLELFHACRQDGGAEHLKANAPFLSEDNNRQWLTQGYYFWVEDVTLADKWGESSVTGEYAILKARAQFSERDILDLVSSPAHINTFKKFLARFMEEMKKKHDGKYNPTVSECIRYYRQLGRFPFKGIRAAEEPHPKSVRRRFIETAENVIALNPRQQLCLFAGFEHLIVDKCIVRPAEWAA